VSAAAAAQSPAAAVGRNAFFLGLFLVAALNSFAGPAIRSVAEQGWAGALAGLFGISAILWAALAAGLKILADDPSREPLRPLDFPVAVLVAAAAAVPVATASMFGLTFLSLYAVATGGAGSPPRRAGIVFLAMTGALIWGRVLLATFSRPLLDLDALFVSAALGVEHRGNLLWSGDSLTRLVVAPGCSSMQGMSLALVFWATVNQLFEVPFGRRAAIACLLALAATVAINVLRIGAMLRFPEHLAAIHTGWGFHLSMWVTLAAVVAICLWGGRREIFR
jgi:exosortase/archaeosortase family protein